MQEQIQELMAQRELVAGYLSALDMMIAGMRAMEVASAQLSVSMDAMTVSF